MNRTVAIIVGVIVVLLVAAGSFFAGSLYGKNQAQAAFTARRAAFGGGDGQFGGQPGLGGQQGANGRGGFTLGQIESIGDGMLTIKDNNGKQTQVKVTDTTLIEKQASVKLSDLTQGETVMVSGSQGADGTITARSVQVAPAGRFGPGGQGGPGAAGTPAP
jgi:hypothetical protein